MKAIATIIIILLIPLALAQGQQDSLIVDSVYVEQGQTVVNLQTFGVTFDSVCYYNIGLRCNAPLDGVHLQMPILYYPPLWSWEDRFDTLFLGNDYIRLIGMDMNNCLITDGQRVHIMTLRFIIAPGTPPQVITIDTVGQLGFGNNPAFRRGYIIIGPLTGTNDGSDQTPGVFELSQNYPNPFNAQTTISYNLPEAGPVTLSIYNIMGQKLATLVDVMQGAGELKIIWDAKDVPSGVYFARLETKNSHETKTLLLLK